MELLIIDLITLWPSTHQVHVVLLFFATFLCLHTPANCRLGNETDRLAFLEFKSKIASDPHDVLSSWNDSVNFCQWQGISCGRKHQRATSLDLYGLSLSGTISPYIGNLTFLRFLNLRNNSFHGVIPQEVGRLSRLRHLNLTDNRLEDEIPVNISYCSELRILTLARNNLVGKLHDELGSLKKLERLDIKENNLTGKIPHSFGNLSCLKHLSLGENNLVGNLPDKLGQLTGLVFFYVGLNNLTGIIPIALYNISSITGFSVSNNQLKGSLPTNVGLTLPNLQFISVGGNRFYGNIPVSLHNSSQLETIDFSANKFMGQVPNHLGHLKNLRMLNLEINLLGSNTSQDLSFITSLSNCSNLEILSFARNNFGGLLPVSIANLSTKLSLLAMGYNQISGRLPLEVGNLVNLYALGMEENLFSGSIPFSFGKLRKLQILYLDRNLLSGEIPSSLGNISNLIELYLYQNRLEGNITSSLANCQSLKALDIADNLLAGFIPQEILRLSSLSLFLNLSYNTLTGPLPLEVHKLININSLDVSHNKLFGEIPERIGDCLMLALLNMQDNFLQGAIPSTFASLRGLIHLDLSRNNLSGNIPKELEKLPFLEYLNLSFNNFEGKVPTKGVFSKINAFSLIGNNNLCGGIPELQLPACPIKRKKNKKSPAAIILAIVISSIVLFMAMAFIWIFYWRKSGKHISFNPIVGKLLRISYNELFRATQGFSSDSLIGQGRFGSVYKGSIDLQGEKTVAVKVLNLQQHGASKSFIAECKALRNIRHRNIVKILTYCTSIDFKGNDFRALVLDFMVNGSLEMWLHPKEDNNNNQPRKLNLLQRLRIAIDVSSALHYLHDHCEPQIIHCDLKPNNILLDNELTAHVGDFGLSRLLPNTTSDSSQGQTSSTGIKGTIGYIPPEYGIGSDGATTSGDVYSFGIILLEIFTGRTPTDELFTDGLSLHSFVRSKLPGQVLQVLDPMLIASGEVGAAEIVEDNERDDDHTEIQETRINVENLRQERGNVQKCIVSVLEIGLACSAELPGDRMNMSDVSRKLNIITEAFLRSRTS